MEPEFTLKDCIHTIDVLVGIYGVEFDYFAWERIKKVLEKEKENEKR